MKNTIKKIFENFEFVFNFILLDFLLILLILIFIVLINYISAFFRLDTLFREINLNQIVFFSTGMTIFYLLQNKNFWNKIKQFLEREGVILGNQLWCGTN